MMRNHRRYTTSHPERRALGILIALLLPTAVSITFGAEDLADLLGRFGMLAIFIAALLTLYWACDGEPGRSVPATPPQQGGRRHKRGALR